MPNVKRALERRLEAINHPRFVEAFVLVLNTLYDKQRNKKEDRFRWHDSGDLQSQRHLEMINDIALQSPRIRHYLPTREVQIVKRFQRNHGQFAPNLFVKVSFPLIGGKLNAAAYDQATVGRDADAEVFQCPALKFQGNECRDCDRCWHPGDVNYPLH